MPFGIFKKFGKAKDESSDKNKTELVTPGPSREALPRRASTPVTKRYGLIQLSGNDNDTRSSTVDVIAVHGLNGDARRSFTDSNTGCCWLSDLLPRDIPDIRVFSYGYEAGLFLSSGSTGVASIYDLSDSLLLAIHHMRKTEKGASVRPLIFIGHNLGGLIIKRLFIRATASEAHRDIAQNTLGVLFMGTPHRGSSVIAWGNVMSKILRAAGVSVNSELLRQMKGDSRFPQILHEDFVLSVSRRFAMYSFYETIQTQPLKRIIVDRSSAVMELPNEHVISLQATHAELCKYSSADDMNYKIVVNALQHLCKAKAKPNLLPDDAPSMDTTTSGASLSNWVPNIVCKLGTTCKGLIEVAGSMDNPKDFNDAELDIVAVHGLGGSPYRSWIHKESQILWLRDFLQRDFPRSRVMSYGYNIDGALQNGILDITQLASDMLENLLQARSSERARTRPMLFIGFSFGGLVIKRALVMIRNGRNFVVDSQRTTGKDLMRSIKQIIFLGVPHQNSAIWVNIIKCTLGIKSLHGFNISASLESVSKTMASFRELEDIFSASVAESEPTLIPQSNRRVLLVSASSARLEWGEREAIFIAKNRNHLQLPTFVDAEDPIYVFIRDSVSNALGRLESVSEAVTGETDACLSVLRRSHNLSQQRFAATPYLYDTACSWILELPELRQWLETLEGHLVIEGPARYGESVINKYLALHLPTAFEDKKAETLYYIFDPYIAKSEEANMMASLIWQLCQRDPSRTRQVIPAFRALGSEFAMSLDTLIKIFLSLTRASHDRRLIIFLDGADEKTMDSVMLQLLDSLKLRGSVGFIITPRSHISISPSISTRINLESTLKSATELSDSEIYIENRLQELIFKNDNQAMGMLEAWLETAVTSFLVIDLVLGYLEEAYETGEILPEIISRFESFSNLSEQRQVSSICDAALELLNRSNSGQSRPLVGEIVSLLAVCQWALPLKALVEALNSRDDSCKEQRDLPNIYTSREVIGIVSVMHRVGLLGRMDEDWVVPRHHLIREYFVSSTHSAVVSATDAHLSLAQKCVTHLRSRVLDTAAFHMIDFLHTFSEYAATNWMIHATEIQSLAGDSGEVDRFFDAVYRLFTPADDATARNKWLLVYEYRMSETLPRHSDFGPLLGGAYFGLLPTVKTALHTGADIQATDETGKSALHWASERGHGGIVSLLLDSGASLNSTSYSGWSSLHFAALKGDHDIVRLLLESGATVNLQGSDGRTPLHCAAENGNVAVVHALVEAGGDVTRKSNTGLSIINIAQNSSSDVVLRELLTAPKVTDALLSRSIFENDPDGLRLLFDRRPDVIVQQYPWVRELLDEHVSAEDALQLLLMSENLSWMPDDDLGNWVQDPPRVVWKTISNFKHHTHCAHCLMNDDAINKEYLPLPSETEQLSLRGHDTSKPKGMELEAQEIDIPDSSSSDSSIASVQLHCLEQHIHELERRERQLISICGVAGIFPPKYSDLTGHTNPGYALMRRNAAQIIYGPAALDYALSPGLTADMPFLQYRDTIDSHDTDGDSIFSVISGYSQISNRSYDSVGNDTDFEIWDQSSAKMIMAALENVLNSIKLLHGESECCDRITVMVKAAERDKVLEMQTICSTDIRSLCQNLEELCEPSDTKGMGWTKPLADLCLHILGKLGFGKLVSEFLTATLGSGKTPSPSRCLHLCALIAQMTSLGVVTYSRGHSREFYTEALSRSVDIFVLGGVEDYWPSIYAERVQLSCLGEMLGRKVWMFHQDGTSVGTFKHAFMLSAKPEDILDTWGGWANVQGSHNGQEMSIQIGGGFIRKVERTESDSAVGQDEQYCHWAPATDPLGVGESYIALQGGKILVGATEVNLTCHLTQATCQAAISPSLIALGTRPPGWKTAGRTTGMSSGHFGVNMTLGMSQTKDDGRNMKRRLIDGYQSFPDLRTLNCPWGLELSLCTGIARRVPLRRLIYGDSLEYLRLGLCGEWKAIEGIVSTISEASDAEFVETLKKLSKRQKTVLRVAVGLLIIAMESTGVGKDGHSLTLWWPEPGEPVPRGIKFTKAQYSGRNPWISMIADSEHCAVFGMATSRCLQHADVKKCRQDVPTTPWQDVDCIMLDTTLSPANSRLNYSYAKDERYSLWKREDYLQVTKPAEAVATGVATASVVQLTYTPGWPKPAIVVKWLKRYSEVKEKQGLSDTGQGVLIL